MRSIQPRQAVRARVAGAAIFAVVGLWCAAPGVAQADDASVTTEGRGIAPLPPQYEALSETPEARAQQLVNDALLDLHALYLDKFDLLSGTGDPGSLSELNRRISAAQARVEAAAGVPIEKIDPVPDFGSAANPASPRSAQAAAASPSSKSLPVTHSTQSTSYYCGPASTAMAIRATCGGGVCERSQYDTSHTMSQDRLASGTYLATTTNGTSMSRIPIALSRWAGISSRLYSSPSASSIKTAVRNSIGVHNRAVIYGTRENAGADNPHYNFHYTTFTIDHLIMGYGYSDSADRLKYADPVAGRWKDTGQAEAPHKTRSMLATSMKTFVAPWGVVA